MKALVTVDPGKCTGCGLCIERFSGYGISETDGLPQIDVSLYNGCKVKTCLNHYE